GIHGAERRLVEVRAVGIAHHPREIGITHRAERGREPAPAHHRAGTADLELLEAVVVAHDAQRAVAILRFEERLPQVRRLEDVPVGVDRAVVREMSRLVQLLAHLVPLRALAGAECQRSANPTTASNSVSAASGSTTLIVVIPMAAAGLRFTPRSSRNATSDGSTPSSSHANR